MSGAQLGKICGCSGLTGGQYLSKSVTATHPEEVETSCELPCRCCIRYQVIVLDPYPTYSKRNYFLFWQKRSFSAEVVQPTGNYKNWHNAPKFPSTRLSE